MRTGPIREAMLDRVASGPFTDGGRCDQPLLYAWSCWGIAPLVCVLILWVSVLTVDGNGGQMCRFTPHVRKFTPSGFLLWIVTSGTPFPY
jgi:hypothetical protein